jgi:putative ABC transport system permease protein
MRIPLLGGRFFSASDTRAREPVVILNEAAAARYFPHDNPVGQMVRISGNRTVVGVVGNVRHDGPEGAWRTQAYVPITQGAVGGATLVVRTTPDARGVAAAVREAVWSEFPDTRIATQVEASTLGDYLDGLVAQRRFNMLILTAFGLLGLVIAAAGIYGVLSYSVARRTREIGVRMALGAQPLGILVSVVRRAALYLACGVALGAAAAWGLGVVVQGFLFEVQAQDATVHAAVVATLTATGLAAALVPARRAARVSPLVAMNAE